VATGSSAPGPEDANEDASGAVTQPGGAAALPTGPGVQKRVAFSRVLNTERQRVDDSYFDSYSYFDIHREMLADKVRYSGKGSLRQTRHLHRCMSRLKIRSTFSHA